MTYTRSLEDDNKCNSLSDLMTAKPMTAEQHAQMKARKVEQRRRLEDYLESIKHAND